MPFRKWAVEPVFLCRKPLPPDKNTCEFYAVTNVQLVNCLRQLSSVAKIADRIFEEIGSECRLVTERCHRLKEKVCAVQDVVENLNARAVKVPISDLSETARFLRTHKPYETKHERRTQLFLPSTRPPCVDQLYNAAATTPVAVICTIDKYRTDGLSGSELFMVTPVLGGEKKKKNKKYLDIETRKPANFSLAKEKQDAVKSGTSSLPFPVSPSTGFLLKQNENLELERLPSPEEQAMLVSLEYPSTLVPVDTSGASFSRMSLLRRSLIHADFVIKRKKSKKKSKRRHTFCEGQNREIEQAIRNVTNSSCQTDDMLDTTVSSSSSIHRSLSKRRSRSAMDNSRRKTLLDELDLDSLQQDSKDSATEDDKEKTPSKSNTTVKKSKTTSSLRSRSFNPISSLSAAISIAAVKMRNSTRGTGNKQDDGRSSSGNWSASSSTRASVDSDHQHAASPIDGVSSPSRNSVGKDSVLSDATQFDPHNRSRDEILLIQSLSSSPIKRKKFGALNLPWEPNGNSRTSKTPTPDFTSHCSSTPVVRSPYAGRRGMSDDGDSSVYSVDTDGYYTSMHTDSGLWCNPNINAIPEATGFRERKESQSSVSTIDNSSINSFLSKSATECSSNSGSIKGRSGPEPPPRVSSCNTVIEKDQVEVKDHDTGESDKSDSPQPQNSSTSESDHEVRDRIRVKTTITPNRYPSLCAVSPETSDEEVHELKSKNALNINVIVAEIHREEKSCDNKETEIPPPMNILSNRLCSSMSNSPINNSSSINMYRSETPLPSNFSSFIPQNSQPAATSTPRSGINITTFSPDLNDARSNKNSSPISKFKEISDFDSEEEITVTETPIATQSGSDKSLIPLKYAQRITVTPIARSDSSSSCTGTIKRTPLKSHNSSSNSVSSPGPEKSFTIPFIKKDSQSSYVSFQAPDSPVSSISSFNKISSTEKISASPTGSLNRPVARVTLDPTGKVVYSSNSLGRVNCNPNRNTYERSYSTLPSNQPHTENRPMTPLKQNISSNEINPEISGQKNPNQNTAEKSCTTSPLTQTYSEMRPITPRQISHSSEVDSKVSIQRNPNRSELERNYTLLPSSQTYNENRPVTPLKQNASSCEISSKISVQRYPNRSTCEKNYAASSSNQMHTESRPITPLRENLSSCNTDSQISVQRNETQSANANQSSALKATLPVMTQSTLFTQNQDTPLSRPIAVKHDFTFRPTRGGRFCRSYFPSHLISPPSSSEVPEKQFVRATYTPPASENPKCNTNLPENFLDYQNLQENPRSYPNSKENSVRQNYFTPKLQTAELNTRYSAPSRPSHYSTNTVPNTASDGNLYARQNSPSTNIWPGRLNNSQAKDNFSPVKLQQPVNNSKLNNTHSDIYAKKITPQSSVVTLRPPDLIPSSESPPSTLDITSPAGSQRKSFISKDIGKDSTTNNQKNLKSMSATELFAIIHSSKKKHNIKTESELSMSPHSSRSVSPALSQSSVSKLQPVETGVLGKRCDTPIIDKTKWCNSMPSTFRKQSGNTLGPTKPTSMHDFKMLLLQTRTGVSDSSPRPSAAELLKVSPTRSSPVPVGATSKLPVPSSLKSPTSQYSPHKTSTLQYSSYKSPTSHYSSNSSYSPVHGTVPVKRNMRTRSPYLTRYDSAYPPIMEDCSEEIENYEDTKCLNSSPSYTQMCKMPDAVPRSTPAAKATSTWV